MFVFRFESFNDHGIRWVGVSVKVALGWVCFDFSNDQGLLWVCDSIIQQGRFVWEGVFDSFDREGLNVGVCFAS